MEKEIVKMLQGLEKMGHITKNEHITWEAVAATVLEAVMRTPVKDFFHQIKQFLP